MSSYKSILAQEQKHYNTAHKAAQPDRQGQSPSMAQSKGTPHFLQGILQAVTLQQTIGWGYDLGPRAPFA